MDASDDERKYSPEVDEEEGKCACPPVVQEVKEPPYRSPVKREPEKRRRGFKRRVYTCPGDASVREGEYALTVAGVSEKYNYLPPAAFDEDSGESLGSLEGDYDPAVIAMNLEAAVPDGPRGEEAIEEVIRDANWGGGRAIIRGEVEKMPDSESGSSE